jgi:hypothetical protein
MSPDDWLSLALIICAGLSMVVAGILAVAIGVTRGNEKNDKPKGKSW